MRIANLVLPSIFAGALFPICTNAASFDCSKASTRSENVICESARLSKLDVEMAALYDAAVRFTVPGDTSNVRDQRAWLRQTRHVCEQTEDAVACLTYRYEERITELRASPTEARDRLVGAVRYTPSDASSHLTFDLSLASSCDDTTCESPGQISVNRKGARGEPQHIDLPRIFITHRSDGSLLTNSAVRYEYQGTINTGDFNFDGAEDFAVQTGNDGSYGGPSYDVFLQDARTARFFHAPALSFLTITGLGFFEIDERRRELVEHTKSGCCWHGTTYFSVQKNMPIPKRRYVEDAMGERVKSFTEAYVNGRWVRAKGKGP